KGRPAPVAARASAVHRPAMPAAIARARARTTSALRVYTNDFLAGGRGRRMMSHAPPAPHAIMTGTRRRAGAPAAEPRRQTSTAAAHRPLSDVAKLRPGWARTHDQ